MAKRTFLDLKNSVEAKVGTNAETGRYLNLAQVELSKLTNRVKTGQVTMTNGSGNLPTDCLVVKAVKWGSVDLEQYSADIAPNMDAGNPMCYSIKDDLTISIYPKNNGTGTLDIAYTPRPTDMALDTDYPSVRDAEEALIAWAIYQLYWHNEDFIEAQAWREKAKDEIENWLKLDGQQNKRPRRVQYGWWG